MWPLIFRPSSIPSSRHLSGFVGLPWIVTFCVSAGAPRRGFTPFGAGIPRTGRMTTEGKGRDREAAVHEWARRVLHYSHPVVHNAQRTRTSAANNNKGLNNSFGQSLRAREIWVKVRIRSRKHALLRKKRVSGQLFHYNIIVLRPRGIILFYNAIITHPQSQLKNLLTDKLGIMVSWLAILIRQQ